MSPALHVLLFGDARGAHNAVGHKLAVLLAAAVLLCFEDEAVGLLVSRAAGFEIGLVHTAIELAVILRGLHVVAHRIAADLVKVVERTPQGAEAVGDGVRAAGLDCIFPPQDEFRRVVCRHAITVPNDRVRPQAAWVGARSYIDERVARQLLEVVQANAVGIQDVGPFLVLHGILHRRSAGVARFFWHRGHHSSAAFWGICASPVPDKPTVNLPPVYARDDFQTWRRY